MTAAGISIGEPAEPRVKGSPRATADELAHRGGSFRVALPPDASEDERATQRAFVEAVAEELAARGRRVKVDRGRTPSGWEELALTA